MIIDFNESMRLAGLRRKQTKSIPEEMLFVPELNYIDSFGIPGTLGPHRSQIHGKDYQRNPPIDKDERTEKQDGIGCRKR